MSKTFEGLTDEAGQAINDFEKYLEGDNMDTDNYLIERDLEELENAVNYFTNDMIKMRIDSSENIKRLNLIAENLRALRSSTEEWLRENQ